MRREGLLRMEEDRKGDVIEESMVTRNNRGIEKGKRRMKGPQKEG